MPLYRIAEDRFEDVAPVSLAGAGITERGDLQRFLRARADVLDPDVLLLAEEYSDWRRAAAGSTCWAWTPTARWWSSN